MENFDTFLDFSFLFFIFSSLFLPPRNFRGGGASPTKILGTPPPLLPPMSRAQYNHFADPVTSSECQFGSLCCDTIIINSTMSENYGAKQ